MSLFKNGNWGLKLIALLLAIALYFALKPDTKVHRVYDQPLFHQP